mmetsp:Transcript_56244/g.131844  ORF Transcript_56244/g.131844 Transcript_56244/m.131844 type:complete len:279 (+) Transcript_56244:876-1712(+)
MFCSRSQHFTSQSSDALKRYGCLSEIATARTVLTCPVRDSFSVPLARSQIFMRRSLPEDANHSFVGSTATVRTQPSWPDITRISFHGGCHTGLGISGRSRSGLTCICVDGSTGAFGAIGTTGPTAGPCPDFSSPSVIICVIADGNASCVASSVPARRNGRAVTVSSVTCSGTSRMCWYSSFILSRSKAAVPRESSTRFNSSFPTKRSCVLFKDFLTARVTGVLSRDPSGSTDDSATAAVMAACRSPQFPSPQTPPAQQLRVPLTALAPERKEGGPAAT